MTVRSLKTLVMLAAVAIAGGCAGPDCPSLCSQVNSCEGATPIDCGTQCATEALNDKASCQDQFDDAWSCVEKRDDICQAPYACQPRFELYLDCVAGYCINKQADFGVNPAPDDQTDPDCAAFGI